MEETNFTRKSFSGKSRCSDPKRAGRGRRKKKGARRREKEVFELLYPDRESNPELSFRRALLYPFNYQGRIIRVQRYKLFLIY